MLSWSKQSPQLLEFYFLYCREFTITPQVSAQVLFRWVVFQLQWGLHGSPLCHMSSVLLPAVQQVSSVPFPSKSVTTNHWCGHLVCVDSAGYLHWWPKTCREWTNPSWRYHLVLQDHCWLLSGKRSRYPLMTNLLSVLLVFGIWIIEGFFEC